MFSPLFNQSDILHVINWHYSLLNAWKWWNANQPFSSLQNACWANTTIDVTDVNNNVKRAADPNIWEADREWLPDKWMKLLILYQSCFSLTN